MRPLYDDGTADPSAVTRDYTLRVDDDAGGAPVLSVFGGKITTYRRLAEQAMDKLAPYFPGLKPALDRTRAAVRRRLRRQSRAPRRATRFSPRHPHTSGSHAAARIFRRHGTHAQRGARGGGDADLGEDFGAGLCEREVRYFVAREWAQTAEDVLWRRTKAGLHLTATQREAVARYLGKL